MNGVGGKAKKTRAVMRRADDRVVRDRLHRHEQLFHVGQIITSEMNLDVLFEVIMDETNQIMRTQRSTVLLHDGEREELWSLVATGMKKNEIRISSDYGVAGWVFQNKTPLIINDAYKDPRFYAEVDKKTGFRTQNILCVPLINRTGKCIGALQTLNNKQGEFTDDDEKLLESLANYVAIALENSRLYEDVKNYSEELRNKLLHIETLEKVKGQLTKFVPSSVAKLAEQSPDLLTLEKVPMPVTVLFLDIQSFSTITEEYDQKLVNDMVETHFSKYLECINRHGGEVNETSGDGLMVIFKEGPLESHARQAVRAGLDIVQENSKLNRENSYPWGKVELHMGINSGEAYVGSTKMKSLTGERWTYTASGLVTVLASRIGGLSDMSRLYIGPETHRCLGTDCACEFIGVHEVKNVKDPIPVYWVKEYLGDLPSPLDG
ncbi:MAG: GAF domain-containing protein [Deltaproteobacteria bacterium]|nr:GAF domain-containing protein [Deltaproteobacteria bacterium]